MVVRLEGRTEVGTEEQKEVGEEQKALRQPEGEAEGEVLTGSDYCVQVHSAQPELLGMPEALHWEVVVELEQTEGVVVEVWNA
jgi:hypothetical protein